MQDLLNRGANGVQGWNPWWGLEGEDPEFFFLKNYVPEIATRQALPRKIDYLVFYNSSNHMQNKLYESQCILIVDHF
jgi:hypothetical protein